MKLLRDESKSASERLAEANRAFEAGPGEEEAAWARLQRAMHGRWSDGRARVERYPARRVGWRLLAGAGARATLGLIVWVVVRPRPIEDRAGSAIARAGAPAAAAAGANAIDRAPLPDRALRWGIDPAPDLRPSPIAAPPPVALAPGRSWLAVGVRARLAPRAAAVVRPGPAPASRVVSLLRGRIDIDIAAMPASAEAAPSGGGESAAPGPEASAATEADRAPSRVEVQVASYRFAPDSGRFSVSARGEKIDVVVRRGKLAVWSSRRLLATVVAGQRWTNLSLRGSARTPAAGGDVSAEVAGVAAAALPAPSDAPSLEPGADNHPAPAADGPDCTRLTRAGDIDGALACFTHASERPGLVGELALMELARIRRDVKGDLAGAERALAEHRRRFPRGALSSEAAGARVELLVRLGRPAEALPETAHLGGGDAIFWRAVCLAKLGRASEAARAFDEYLARPDGKRRAEAERMRRDVAP
jgi:hypothetical protein